MPDIPVTLITTHLTHSVFYTGVFDQDIIPTENDLRNL